MGGEFHLRLNKGSRPIGNKYHEGKGIRILKRELNAFEIAAREGNRTSALGEIVVRYGDCWLHQRKRCSLY